MTHPERGTGRGRKSSNLKNIAVIVFITAGFWGPSVVDLTVGLGLRYPNTVPHWIAVGSFSVLFGLLWVLSVGMVISANEV